MQKSRINTRLPTTQFRTDRKGSVVSDTKISSTSAYQYQFVPDTAKLGAYRTTSTAALQVILGIPPLHLQLQREARGTALFRLRLPLSTNVSDIDPSEIEEKATGWSTHPLEHLSPTQISLDDGGNINTGLRIYTDGSKTEKGVGAAFCVLTDVNITHRWSTRLSLRNTVFQAEILALLKAVEHAVTLPTQ
ncbi:hypothetical protein AVEN_229754-1 [Araneus ventricosus]|uniref:Uncharacterized protein n=1 Tax=Araneus ventricosus TaxID=182803 RepID=A0A4Y2WUM9_ARAVE|nr:hypothetical protein AVEN_229754-1 [Araneus ventricosus]